MMGSVGPIGLYIGTGLTMIGSVGPISIYIGTGLNDDRVCRAYILTLS